MTWLWVALAGGLGAAARYVTDGLLSARGPRGFPIATLTINVLGSFGLGLVAGALDVGTLRAVLGTGFLGGFTTFSTASVELVRVARSGRPWMAVTLALAMLALALAAAVGGLTLGAGL